MLESALLCVVASLNNLLLKKSLARAEESQNPRSMLVDNVGKTRIFTKSFCFKTQKC